MRRCIVHFGMPKTGSSSIQATLFGREGDRALRYLHAGAANGSGMLATAFMANPGRFHVNRKLGLDSETVAQRQQDLLAALERQLDVPADLYLLSGESLSNFRAPDLRNLVRWLSRRVDCVEAVGYIRPPRAFMESAFQQNVKSTEAHLDFAHLYPDYRERFERMDKAFEAENVHYWKFDPASFPGGDVVRDFAQRIGLDLGDTPIKRVNEGLSRDAVSLLYCFRQHGPGWGSGPGMLAVNGQLVKTVATLQGDKLRFSDAVTRPVIQARTEDLAWMERRLGASLTEPPQQDGDTVSDATQLLHPSDQATRWLANQLGDSALTEWVPGLPPERCAQWMLALRDKLGAEREAQRSARRAPKIGRRAADAATLAAQPAPSTLPAGTRPSASRSLDLSELVRRAALRLGPSGPSPEAVEQTLGALLALLKEELDRNAPKPVRLADVGTLRSPVLAKPLDGEH